MTCVVAYRLGESIYMGADSAGTSQNWLYVPRNDPKIYRVRAITCDVCHDGDDEFLFGFTTSFRMGQLLGHRFKPPIHAESRSVDDYMVVEFIDALRQCMKDAGYATKKDEKETSGSFLVAYRGRIFHIDDDYSVGESQYAYDAVGSGTDAALGAFYALTTTTFVYWSPEQIVDKALRAAESVNAAVRGPFIYERLPKDAL
jgi:ATP-dependent protease HslVU (ClpYQ) peptidase subunit